MIVDRPEPEYPPCECSSCRDWINEMDFFKRDAFNRPICLECHRIEVKWGLLSGAVKVLNSAFDR